MTQVETKLDDSIRTRLVVQKYGGTSVGSPERINAVADNIASTVKRGHSVVVVVSAMGATTDELIDLANKISSNPPGREMDMLLTAGERISMSLLCMALHERGLNAISFTGSQAGILTDTAHGKAKIIDIKADRLCEALEKDQVCVVAGFQGVSTTASITTLGRGGSDTTAVALAAALKASACEIYTDVTGVFSADPRIVDKAKKLAHISYEEMLEMAATGGRVLALRSVEFARNFQVPLHVRSSFSPETGTWIYDQESNMEDAIVSAVTHDGSEVKFTLENVPDQPGVAAQIFRALSEENLNVDMIVQNVSREGLTDISFTVPADEKIKAIDVLEDASFDSESLSYKVNEEIGRISVVGAGMKSHPGVAATMFETLAAQNINIQMISTSTIRISVVVDKENIEKGVVALHSAFGLDS
ncbi:MAG: aspartate kinase [Acidimicrobiia bacterium]